MGILLKSDVESLPTKDLERAHAYWCSMHKGQGLPRRQDLDPCEIVGLLPKVNLVDVALDNGVRRYRHRLVGTGVVNLFRIDSTGRWFEEIYSPEHLQLHLPAYERAIDTGTPNVEAVTVALPGKTRGIDLGYWRLILPMTRSGDRTDMLLLVFDQMSTDTGSSGSRHLYRNAGG